MLNFCLNCGNDKIKDCNFCIKCGCELSDVKPLTIFEPGAVLYKRYKIQSLLRETEGGIVYIAEDLRFKTLCVVKELFLNYDNDLKKNIENVREEIKIFCTTRHPCLPVITNYFVENGRQYLVMDYFDGKSLQQVMEEKENAIPKEDVIGFTIQILDLLDYIHTQEHPIIYRDINPENIMIKEQDGRIVFLDFYISSADPDAREKGVLPAGNYSAPEEKKGEFSVKSDIFSTGATVYHLLTGKAENFSDGKFEKINKVLNDIEIPLAELINKALSINPEDRYDNVSEMKIGLLNVNTLKEKSDMLEFKKEEFASTGELSEKPSYVSIPAYTKPMAKEISAKPAETRPIPVSTGKAVPEKEDYGDLLLGKTEKSFNIVRNVVILLTVLFSLALIYGIYWFINNTIMDSYFTSGTSAFKQGLDKAGEYNSSQGKSGYIEALENYNNASSYFESYVGKNKGDAKGYYVLGHCYYQIYRLDVAKKTFDGSKLLNTNLLKATDQFKEAILHDPNYTDAYYYLAVCYYYNGDWFKARENFENCKKSISLFFPGDTSAQGMWYDRVKEGEKCFINFETLNDPSVSGSSVQFINGTNITANLEVNSDVDVIQAGNSLTKTLKPGICTFKISIKDYSFSDKITVEDKTIYTFKIRNMPEDHFSSLDIKSLKNKR